MITTNSDNPLEHCEALNRTKLDFFLSLVKTILFDASLCCTVTTPNVVGRYAEEHLEHSTCQICQVAS